MLSPETFKQFEQRQSRDLCISCTRALIDAESLNHYLEMVLPQIGRAFGTSRVALIDYREQSDHYVLLHHEGYPPDAHYSLQRRMDEMQVKRALKTRLPYLSKENPRLLCIPLYFRDILEALLVLEFEEPVPLPEGSREVAEVISKSLGLLMSSTRLKVNQDQMIDMNDLQQARQIQLSFLPGDLLSTDIYEVFGYNSSSALVGGDYFDYFSTRPGSIQGILADACGHGMAAALIVSTFRGLLHSEMGQRQDFDGLFDAINASVYSGGDFIRYLTGVFFDYENEKRRLRYFNAGHYDPILIDRRGRLRTLGGGGPPLGMFKGSEYTLLEAELQPGDLLALFTDGLIDMQNDREEYFGLEGLTKVLQNCFDLPLKDLSQTILSRAVDFSRGAKPEDDITLFLMRLR